MHMPMACFLSLCPPPDQVYKEKLRELRRVSRSLFKRVDEAAKRPKLVNHLLETINASFGFVAKMKNMSEELQIFTDVEIDTLESLANESMVGGACCHGNALLHYQCSSSGMVGKCLCCTTSRTSSRRPAHHVVPV